MGVVYKAEDTKLKRFVALKFLRSDVLEDEEHRERFLREAQAAASLDHSNICTVHEIDEVEGKTFIAMAFIEGQTVKDKIAERPLKLQEALDITIQTARGLQAAHEKGIVHRDIKSANLMVTPQRQVKVMDFGLAQLAERSQLTKTATMLGTPAYMSPEQAQRLPTDRRTDIWSLGVVIYEMVTGRLPFEGERQQAVLYAIANEEAEPITALRVGVPTDLDRLVGKAMAKDAGERYQHVDEMLVDLRSLRKERESGASRAAPLRQRGFRKTAWRAGAALAAVVLVAAVVWLRSLRQPVESPQPPLRVTPLTTYPGYESLPSFSPSGDQVVFVWDGDNRDNSDLYVKLVGEGTPLRLTHDPAADSAPAWSPDGRQIAFMRFGSQPEGAADVMLVPPIGGSERKLAQIDSPRIDVDNRVWRWNSYGLAWSPDGKQLAVVGRDSPQEPYGIFLLSVETGEKSRLTQPRASTGWDLSPDFSPDGQKVAFVRLTSPYVADIHVVRVTGGRPERVTDLGAHIGGLAWTSDDREIIFSMRLPSGGVLYRIPASGGNPRQVAAVGEAHGRPALAPQARRLAYGRVVFDSNIWRDRRSLRRRPQADEAVDRIDPHRRQRTIQSRRQTDRFRLQSFWTSGNLGVRRRRLQRPSTDVFQRPAGRYAALVPGRAERCLRRASRGQWRHFCGPRIGGVRRDGSLPIRPEIWCQAGQGTDAGSISRRIDLERCRSGKSLWRGSSPTAPQRSR